MPPQTQYIWPAVIIGAVLPDIDILWFYFIDHGAIHHHRYWVHIPAFWVTVAIIVLPLLKWIGALPTGLVFFTAIFMHLVLDSISGGIMWAAPLDNTLYSLVSVPATQSHWILSFLLHWTFVVEVLIWTIACVLWGKARKSKGRAVDL